MNLTDPFEDGPILGRLRHSSHYLVSAVIWTCIDGEILPIACLTDVMNDDNPINISLHNMDKIGRLDLHHEDTVLIQGKVASFPEISSVVLQRRSPNAKPILAPQYCPECGNTLHRVEGRSDLYCTHCSTPLMGLMGIT